MQEEIKASIAAPVPLGVPGDQDEVAKAVVFHAFADSSFVTGIACFVSGDRHRCNERWLWVPHRDTKLPFPLHLVQLARYAPNNRISRSGRSAKPSGMDLLREESS